ncbi:putative acetyltransferase [Zalerion maritima]|uniref:Acetyltransferase n=1 Tax=Zalerion maritima TaxID=339359 RepID=A0AAD5RHU4_9PEZI|nr:putative acetyltransferase [Zalerion maritima]
MPTSSYVFTQAEHAHLTPYLAALHASCITHDSTIATFLPPLNHDKLLTFWKEGIAEANSGKRLIMILLDESDPGSRAKGTELVGVATMVMPQTETGPFRGFIEKVFVSTKARRKGYGRRLMAAVEMEAVGRGRTLLMIDTEQGSAAESFYRSLNFIEVGKIPNYGASPAGGLRDEVFFYKDLRQHS